MVITRTYVQIFYYPQKITIIQQEVRKGSIIWGAICVQKTQLEVNSAQYMVRRREKSEKNKLKSRDISSVGWPLDTEHSVSAVYCETVSD